MFIVLKNNVGLKSPSIAKIYRSFLRLKCDKNNDMKTGENKSIKNATSKKFRQIKYSVLCITHNNNSDVI